MFVLEVSQNFLTFFAFSPRFKVSNSLNEIDGRPCSNHPLGMHINFKLKDKNGMAKSVLNIPYSRRQESHQIETINDDEADEPINVALFDYRGHGDGGISTDFTTTVMRGTADGVGAEDSDFDSCDENVENVALVSVKKLNADDLLPKPKESNSSFNSNNSSGFASSCGSSSETSPVVAHPTNDRQTENEIDEICYQATTTTFTKVSKDFEALAAPDLTPGLGKCRVLYDYTANMYDELSIRVGDVINIHDKQADGWWLGELRGTIGIFPATYVEEDESHA